MARKRRGRGEGGIHQRADGLWEAKISLGYDASGKRRRPTVYGKTKAEVQEKLRELQSNAGKGSDEDSRRLTVSAWLTRWLELIGPTVEPNTFRPYGTHVRLHLDPILGSIKLAKLKRADITNLYPALDRKGVSAAMQRKIGTTLTIALNKAVDLDLIPSNPAVKVRKPKAKKEEMKVLDPGQVSLLLTAAEPDRLYAFYPVALDSGARPGELFALLWSDVDFERGFISITKSLEDIGGNLRVKAAKTEKSRRRIDLSRHTLEVLAEHRKRMLAEGHYAPDRPVFCSTTGGYLRKAGFYRGSFKPLLKRGGLPVIRPYDLRHTCATLLLLANESPKVVAERLGHSSVKLTLDIYSHVLPTMQKRAADIMGRILGQRPQKNAE